MEHFDKTLRINAPKGQKVIFKGPKDALWGGGQPDNRLEEGMTYSVNKTKVFGSCAMVELEEYPGAEFNTVLFEETGKLLAAIHTPEELYRKGLSERLGRLKGV